MLEGKIVALISAHQQLQNILDAAPPVADVPDASAYGIYGVGELGELTLDLLQRADRKVSGLWDRNQEQVALFAERNGLPTGLANADKDQPVIVCISKVPYGAMCSEIRARGFTKLINFYDFAEKFESQTGFDNGWRLDDVNEDERAAFTNLLDAFEDEISRDHLCEFLQWHRLRIPGGGRSEFNPVLNERYFPDFIRNILRDDETFIDVGANTGSVLRTFHDLRQGAYQCMIGIEPDPINLAAAIDNTADLDSRTQLMEIGIGSVKRATPYIIGRNFCSGADAAGDQIVREIPLDELNIAPTFLKIHVEGRELDVLTSAAKTLHDHRPIIAATVYHQRHNLIETSEFLFRHLTEYRYAFRCHGHLGSGAVFYAIPFERT